MKTALRALGWFVMAWGAAVVVVGYCLLRWGGGRINV